MLISIFPGSSISIPLAPSLRTSPLLPDKRGRCPPKLPARMWPVLKQPVQWHVQHAGSNRADLLPDNVPLRRFFSVKTLECFVRKFSAKLLQTRRPSQSGDYKRSNASFADQTRSNTLCWMMFNERSSKNTLQWRVFMQSLHCKLYSVNFAL